MQHGTPRRPGHTARYLLAAAALVTAAGAASWLLPSDPPAATASPQPVPQPATSAPTTTTPPISPPPTAPSTTTAPPPSGTVSASLDVDGLELFKEHPFDELVYRLDLAVGEPPASVTVGWDPRLGDQLVAVGGAGCTTNPCTIAVPGAGARVVASVRPAAGLDPRTVTATVTGPGLEPVTVTAAELPDRMPPPVAEPARWPRLVAWCGIEPTDPRFAEKASALVAAGVGAMHGPCRRPDWATYSAIEPGRRYMSADEYQQLVAAAAPFGLRVIVYDQRVWSSDPAERAAAIEQWRPAARSGELLAFDASDEINRDQWPVLVERHDRYSTLVQPELAVPLFASHLPWMDQLAARDVPAMVPLSVNTFWEQDSAALEARHPGVPLHCTLDLAAFGPFNASPDSIEATVAAPWAAACHSWLVFNPTSDANPDLFANAVSTWEPDGTATPLLDAVRDVLGSAGS